MITLFDQEGRKFLIKNKAPLICPFGANQPMPRRLQGQIAVHERPCSSECVFFHEHKDATGTKVQLLCTSQKVVFDIKENTAGLTIHK